jgi:hypothetical protein
MRNRNLTLVRIIFFMVLLALLGYLNLFDIQSVSADKNSDDKQYGLQDILEYGPLADAPILLPISNPDGNGDYLVDWSDVPAVNGYRLEEDDNLGFLSPIVRYTGTDSQFQVTGQPTGLWYYRVLDTDTVGDSIWSNTESVGVVPAAPILSSISNSDGNGDYLVDWNDVTGATAYVLQEDDNSAFSSPTVRYSGAASQFQVNGQPTGLWYYQVQASNTGGNSAWSNIESVGVVPAAPVLLAISNADGNGNYQVDWSDVTGASSYVLQEDDNLAFTSPTTIYSGSNSQHQVNGQVGGTWYYRVQASGTGGFSAWSNTESASVIPAAPVLTAISNPDGNGDYLVDWNVVTGSTTYVLQEDDNLAFTSPTERYNGAASEYSVTGQLTGLWYYRVLARNAGGDSIWSNTQSVGVVPAAPVLAAISNPDGNGDYLVDWNDVTGATSYELQAANDSAFTTPSVRYSGAISQFQETVQTTGLWYYRVRAINTGGNSAWSNTVSVSVVPAAPVLAAISNPDGNGDYLVDWSDVTGAISYELQEDDNLAFTSPTQRYVGTNSQYQIIGQQLGTWYYRVRAINAGGTSPWSNTEPVVITVVPPSIIYIYLPLVNSPKSEVRVLPISSHYEADNTLNIVGEVLNYTSNNIGSVKVTIHFFDASGQPVGTTSNYTYIWPNDLPSGEKGCFKITMGIPPNWSYYQFEAPTYILSSTSSGLTIFGDSGLYNPSSKGYIINGQVRNNGNQRSNNVGVSGTLYNAYSVPVGCEHGTVNTTNIAPGQSSSFIINFLERDYVDVTYYKLRVAGDMP